MTTSVLLISNHGSFRTDPGRIDALQCLSSSGEIGKVDDVYAGERPDESEHDRNHRVIRAVDQSGADLLIVLSMKRRITDVDGFAKAAAGRPILYWEGDPWGGRKRIPPEMSQLLELSTLVFSVGGRPQSELLLRHGARKVHHTIHTYDHILFGGAEKGVQWARAQTPLVFLGTNFARIPGVTGLPGSLARFYTVARLRRRFGDSLLLGGPGWPSAWGVGRVPFADQGDFLRRGKIVVNWDHFPEIHGYTSDRLAIAMAAGRPQVSTLHPQMDWAPGPAQGVFLHGRIADAVHAATELQDLPDHELRLLGNSAQNWALPRISHRESMRAMLSTYLPGEVSEPPSDPWGRLLPPVSSK